MAGDAKKLQPIIIKRIKKGGHGAHGGAWKIAYADFVTAMMAFFLLMWLLGSTTDGDKKGIADFFQAPLRVSLLGGGSGAGDASHLIKGGGESLSTAIGQIKRGDIPPPRDTVNLHKLRDELRAAEAGKLRRLQQQLENELRNNPSLAPYASQIRIDMTFEGLRIQIVDEGSRPMFDSGSAAIRGPMRDILRAIGSVLAEVPNRLTLAGHTDPLPFAGGDRGYGNWELSADRANASRRELIAGGLTEERVLRVQGLAASQPLDRNNPLDPQNRRISIVVMNREAEERFFQSAAVEEGAPRDRATSSPPSASR